MYRTEIILGITLLAFILTGCETIKEGGRKVGAVAGETANTIGSVSEGGAEAVKGKETNAENPYGR